MSGSIEALTAALTANTETLIQHNAILTQMMEKAGTKPAAAPAATAAEKAKPGSKPKAKTENIVTVATLKDGIGVWLGASPKGSAENIAKSAMLKKILESVGADKVTNIPTEKLVEANTLFEQVKAGEDPFAEEAEEEQAEDDLL